MSKRAPYPIGRAPASLARALGVPIRTVRNWRKAGTMPAVYVLGLALVEDGDLGAVAPGWRGWMLKPHAIVSPDGWEFEPGQIQAAPILRQLVGELRRQLGQPAQRELALR